MNQDQNKYSENMLKGRMAETMVEELLKRSGNTVYRFGYEAIMQNLTQIKRNFDMHSDTAEKIRAIPDFIVVEPNGNTIFLEVKYRWNGQLHEDDIKRFERIGSFWKAKIVIVNSYKQPFFQISNPPYVKDGQLISRPLPKDASLKIDPIAYKEMEVLVSNYLSSTLFPPPKDYPF